ncbi:MAG TPA: c-type cytochrome [Bellilinea sp.]|nr:c-type cytochrome [Bellilinea sp.]
MEKLAKALVIILVLVAIAVPIIGSQLTAQADVIDLHARMPENGGWSEEVIRGQVGQKLRLRMTSDDVLHGFAVAQSSLPEVELFPGKFSQTELVFDQPGEYTFYCTRWCGTNHWRMRGTIVIEGPPSAVQLTSEAPLFLRLNLDLDAAHLAKDLPVERPDAIRGSELATQLQTDLDREMVWSASPEALWQELSNDPQTAGLDDQQVWDIAAWALSLQGSQVGLVQGKALYAQNCLACHGESGQGDGVIVRGRPTMDHLKMGAETVRPPDFSDPAVLLGASPAVLEGKIIRGGMGTGMPYWGDIFTSEQIRDLVLYLYTFQMNLTNIP